MKVIIDWSILCRICWHRMESKNYIPVYEFELAEFSMNLAKDVLYYRERFPDAEIIFALDDKTYWRQKIYTKFYRENTKCFRDIDEESYLLEFDGRKHCVKYSDIAHRYIISTVPKKEFDPSNWNHIDYAELPEEVLAFIPKYKGARLKAKWKAKTTKAEFKAFLPKYAKHLANVIDARVIHVKQCEADDVAYALSVKFPAETKVYVTYDSDWHQIATTDMFTYFVDPRDKSAPEIDRIEIHRKLMIKIMGGDDTDSIPGITLKTGGKVGEDKAIAIYDTYGRGTHKYILANADASYMRNIRLINLKNMPPTVLAYVTTAVDSVYEAYGSRIKKESPYTWKDFGVSPRDILVVKNEANHHREADTFP